MDVKVRRSPKWSPARFLRPSHPAHVPGRHMRHQVMTRATRSHPQLFLHHTWLLRRRQHFCLFVIRSFTCGVALMLRRRQPTVVAQRPPSASFDATHPLISLFSFHFSRRERAATQAATSARNAPPAPKTKKEARSATAGDGVCRAQAHSARSWSFWPSSGPMKLRLCRATA